jgi:hypothetical protein
VVEAGTPKIHLGCIKRNEMPDRFVLLADRKPVLQSVDKSGWYDLHGQIGFEIILNMLLAYMSMINPIC